MGSDLTTKERLAIPRLHMPELDAAQRSRSFEEVNRGLSMDEAVREALRCIQCKHRPCVAGCPVGVSIPEFLGALAGKDLPVENWEGWAAALHCQRMELGPPDESGRHKPVPVEGAFFDLPAEVVVNAVGTRANPLLTATAPELKVNRWGNIVGDESGATSLPGVFAGGDIVRGGATVILAMGDGKRAAAAIHDYLTCDNV